MAPGHPRNSAPSHDMLDVVALDTEVIKHVVIHIFEVRGGTPDLEFALERPAHPRKQTQERLEPARPHAGPRLNDDTVYCEKRF
jgi:hypothetical protein